MEKEILNKIKPGAKLPSVIMVKEAPSVSNAFSNEKQNKIRTQLVDCIAHYQEIIRYALQTILLTSLISY